MGTNYYVIQECPTACAHCGLGRVHLGKQSGGWPFSHALVATDGVVSHERWLDVARSGRIEDEYGVETTLEELLLLQRSTAGNRPPDLTWALRDGHSVLDGAGRRWVRGEFS